MSWQPPYNPSAPSAPPGYPTGSTVPPGYPSATATLPPGYPTGTAPPGYPTSATYPAGYATGSNDSYPVTGGQVNYGATGYPPVPPGYAQYPQQGLYPTINPQTSGAVGYAYAPQDVVGYVFRPTEHEKSKHRMDVKYSTSLDKYIRVSEHSQEFAGWRTAVYAAQNIKRKVEDDHHMSYLARQESSVFARIEWRIDSSEAGLHVKRFHLQFPTKLYEDGNVNAYIASERGDIIPIKHSDNSQEFELKGVQRFSISAELSRGTGEHAWQHAQLFRQKLKPGFFSTDDSIYPFRFSVEFQ